jgi:hypothetical protein
LIKQKAAFITTKGNRMKIRMGRRMITAALLGYLNRPVRALCFPCPIMRIIYRLPISVKQQSFAK